MVEGGLGANKTGNCSHLLEVPDFEMTITPLNSKFSEEFDKVSGISRHFHEAQTLNFLRVFSHYLTNNNITMY